MGRDGEEDGEVGGGRVVGGGSAKEAGAATGAGTDAAPMHHVGGG